MMDEFSSQVNDALNVIYSSVRKVEEKMLKTSVLNLTTTELDLLMTISKYGDKGCSVSEIAKDNKVTTPTVTVAIKRLEKKGFVEKLRSSEDGRMVNIVMTRMGHKANAAHRYFHERMVRAFLKNADEETRPSLLLALNDLGDFLKKIGDAE